MTKLPIYQAWSSSGRLKRLCPKYCLIPIGKNFVLFNVQTCKMNHKSQKTWQRLPFGARSFKVACNYKHPKGHKRSQTNKYTCHGTVCRNKLQCGIVDIRKPINYLVSHPVTGGQKKRWTVCPGGCCSFCQCSLCCRAIICKPICAETLHDKPLHPRIYEVTDINLPKRNRKPPPYWMQISDNASGRAFYHS